MRRLHIASLMLSTVSAILAASACGPAAPVSSSPPVEAGADTAPAADAAPAEDASDASDASVPSEITVTTRQSALAPAVGAKASVTWAAYRDAAGAWKTLAPTSAGTYTFTTAAARWGIALVCASADDLVANVNVYYRTPATKSLDVPVATLCATAGPATVYHKLTGTLSNLPATATRFAFGFGQGSLDTTLTLAGTDAPYTYFSLAEGTWDFAYAIRDAFTGPLTRVLLRRGEIMGVADRTLDVDMNAAGSFVPVPKNITVRGLAVGETLVGSTFFTTQGNLLGLSVGPNSPPQLIPDNTFPYSTIAAAAAVASDVYRGEFRSSVPGGATERVVAFNFKTPADVDVAFLPYVGGLAATVSASAPYVRLETKASTVTSADLYQIFATASAAKGTRQSWSISYDAPAVAPATSLDDIMPDLSAVPGWKNAWALPAGIQASVSVSIVEKSTVVSDGTGTRTTTATTKLTP